MQVNALDMAGHDDLDRFSVFFADSVNKIALAAMLRKKITFHVFGIRNLIVRKIAEDELLYLKRRIKESTSIFKGSKLTEGKSEITRKGVTPKDANTGR